MAARFPVREYLGKYEGMLARMYKSRTLVLRSKLLDKFFSHFPNNVGLEQFSIADATDYRDWRRVNGAAEGAILMEMNALRYFWKWLIVDKGLPLFNPFKGQSKPSKVAVNKNGLKLEDFRRLLQASDSADLSAILLAMIGDFPIESRHFMRNENKRSLVGAAKRAGLDWVDSFRTLREAIYISIWREIIRREFPKLSEAFWKEGPIEHYLAPVKQDNSLSEEDMYELIGM